MDSPLFRLRDIWIFTGLNVRPELDVPSRLL